MPVTITVPDELYAVLEKAARPFTDKEPADVIARIVGDWSASSGRAITPPLKRNSVIRSDVRNARRPRERGARVRLDGEIFLADSVRDLFEQVLRHISKTGKLAELKKLMPYKTSRTRYLISATPVHPTGHDFVVPVGQMGLYFEAHKSYATALSQLSTFLTKLDIQLEYVP